MNAMSIHNRFEKKQPRRVRLGITRGQAILFLLTFSLFFYLLTELVFASSAHKETLKGKEVTVRSGDSLWTIAVRHHHSEKVDVRDLIFDIKMANNLDSNLIYPGQTLFIPETD
ncbi:LysM peptidoglycan-binding domain-containing protein [Brevibacillus sp. NSP2.1]|uniref:cell division suppressor protein YneA n=1 Tax=Brevibacillus sp. NSP2.1 TaxID=3003229 RepID=UPI0004158B2B|nr:LysM peptidoglycan-binding domain-containing protein [Brevibacillus sp. NSP2.1]QHZ56368.1 LysM peptidoglycan-binding domain-containing protein [Brevibacillus sp. NSP2.1]